MPSIQEPLEAKQEPVQLHAHPWQACVAWCVVWGGAKHMDSTQGLLMAIQVISSAAAEPHS